MSEAKKDLNEATETEATEPESPEVVAHSEDDEETPWTCGTYVQD